MNIRHCKTEPLFKKSICTSLKIIPSKTVPKKWAVVWFRVFKENLAPSPHPKLSNMSILVQWTLMCKTFKRGTFERVGTTIKWWTDLQKVRVHAQTYTHTACRDTFSLWYYAAGFQTRRVSPIWNLTSNVWTNNSETKWRTRVSFV